MKVSTPAKKQQPLVTAGVQEARCFSVVDLGTQETEYEGVVKYQRKLKFFFELPEFQITYEKDGVEVTAPQVINIEFTNSGSPKGKLKPAMEAWVGKPIEQIDFIADCVGRPASLSIVHKVSKKGSTYANIASITALSPKLIAMLAPQHNKDMHFDIDVDEFDSDNFKNLYKWVQEDIMKSEEYKEYVELKQQNRPAGLPEDIPFDM